MKHLASCMSQLLSKGEKAYKKWPTKPPTRNAIKSVFLRPIAAHRLGLFIMFMSLGAISLLPSFEAKALDYITILNPKNNSRALNPSNVLVEVQLNAPGSHLQWMIVLQILRMNPLPQKWIYENLILDQLELSSDGKFLGKKFVVLEEGDFSMKAVALDKLTYAPFGEAVSLFRVKRLEASLSSKPLFSILEPSNGDSVGKEVEILVGSPFAVDFILRLERKRSDAGGTDVMWSKQCKHSDFAENEDWKRWVWMKTEEVELGRYVLSASPLHNTIEKGTVTIEFTRSVEGLRKHTRLSAPSALAVSPPMNAVFGNTGGTVSFTINGGQPPYQVSTSGSAYPPLPANVPNSGGAFSATVPANSPATTVAYTVTDSANHTATALLAVTLAQAQQPLFKKMEMTSTGTTPSSKASRLKAKAPNPLSSAKPRSLDSSPPQKDIAPAGSGAFHPIPKRASIWFDLSISPAPKPMYNQPFNLVIGITNTGNAKNDNGPVVRLSCEALNGGNCEKLLGDPVVPPIEPGKTETLNLRQVFKVTQGGNYRVLMVLDPEPQPPVPVPGRAKRRNLAKSYSFDFDLIVYHYPTQAGKKEPKAFPAGIKDRPMAKKQIIESPHPPQFPGNFSLSRPMDGTTQHLDENDKLEVVVVSPAPVGFRIEVFKTTGGKLDGPAIIDEDKGSDSFVQIGSGWKSTNTIGLEKDQSYMARVTPSGNSGIPIGDTQAFFETSEFIQKSGGVPSGKMHKEMVAKGGAGPELSIQHRFELLSPADGSTYTDRKVALKVGTPHWMPFHINVDEIAPGSKTVVDASWGSQSPSVAGSRWVKQKTGQWVYTDLVILNWGKTYEIKIKPDPQTGQLPMEKDLFAKVQTGKTSATFKVISLEVKTQFEKLKKGELKKEPALTAKSPMTALILLNKKTSYVPGEEVRVAIQGDPGAKPEVQCSPDGTRWETDCPGVMLRPMGNQWVVQTVAPGKYKFSLGNAEEEFEVKAGIAPAAAIPGAAPSSPASPIQHAPAPAATPAAKMPAAAAPGVKIPEAAQPVKKTPASPAPLGTPQLSLGQRTFTGPSKVKLSIRADSRFRVRYVLEKKINGGYREVSTSDKPEFDVGPGEYRVKAQYENGAFGPPVAFTVRVPMVTAPATDKPQTIKIPKRPMMKAQ